MTLFKFKFNVDLDDLRDAKYWSKLFIEGIGTLLWILIANQAVNAGTSEAWAWGLIYSVLHLTFNGSFNTLNNFAAFFRGETDLLSFILSFAFHILGSLAAVAASQWLGLGLVSFDASLSFQNVISAEFYKFFFGAEFLGIFLFSVFSMKAKENEVPKSVWSVLLVATAFWIGGAGFGFFPARAFTNFGSFVNGNVWATVLVQFWAMFVALLVNEYAFFD